MLFGGWLLRYCFCEKKTAWPLMMGGQAPRTISSQNKRGIVGLRNFCLQKRCILSKSSDVNKATFPNKNLLGRAMALSDTIPCFTAPMRAWGMWI